MPGTGSPMRWFFSAIWLVYLIQPVSGLFGHHNGVAWIAGGLAITVAFCVIYMLVLMYSDEQPRLGRYGLVAIAVLAALACVVYGNEWTPLWIYVSAATGLVLAAAPDGRQAAMLGVAGVGACYVFFAWLSHETLENSLIVLLPVLLIGLAMMGFRMQMTLMQELAQARGTVAKLAANEERLRLARDMHDLTGQSLSMITLKSELAAKRLAKLPSSAERDAVLTELGDIGRVSRQTLHDIREAVSGYRRPTLAIEVITARNALEAAGIGFDDDAGLTLRSGTFDPDAEAVLAWCLREAVTNVIRHSRARHCHIRLADHAWASCPSRSPTTATASPAKTGTTPGEAGCAACPNACPPSAAACRWARPSPATGSHSGHNDRGFRLIATVPVAAAMAVTGHNCGL